MKIKNYILVLFLIPIALSDFSAQCDTGTEDTCKCETAPILCTITELDGYQSYMSTFQHPEDAPWAFCGIDTKPDNPNWFGFIAWCSSFKMDVLLSNCVEFNNWEGVQLAIFENCDTDTPVACNSVCNGDGNVSLSLENLIVGEVYYFMMDGCSGATCDYVISLSETTCDELIDNWTLGVQGEDLVCEGSTESYFVEDLKGASNYHWYIKGTQDTIITESAEHDMFWDEGGVFELCVDVSNACFGVDLDPDPICKIINVRSPNAGEFVDFENQFCPGEDVEIEVADFYDDVNYLQYLIVTNSENKVTQLVNDAKTTLSSENCEEYTIYSINFPSVELIELPTIGQEYTAANCILNCCDEHVKKIEFIDTEFPRFIDELLDESIENFSLLPELEELLSTDNCDGEKMIEPTEEIFGEGCTGGTVVRTWSRMDQCGNETSVEQTIIFEGLELPISRLGEDFVLDCVENTATLDVGLCYITDNTSIQWVNQEGEVLSTEESCLISEPGSYYLILTDLTFDCESSVDEINIGYDESYALEPLLADTTIVKAEKGFTFSPNLFFDESLIQSILWETDASLSCFDCLRPDLSNYMDGDVLYLTIHVGDDCIYTASTVIGIEYETRVFIPNIFNPNSDENFTIYSNGEVVEILQMQIFDRYGNRLFENKLFEPNDTSFGWDGSFLGEELMSGVYVYRFVYLAKGKKHDVVGDITLIN